MPNGGSDCCGTCWFNASNKGEAGYDHRDPTIPAHCSIRGLPMERREPVGRPEFQPEPVPDLNRIRKVSPQIGTTACQPCANPSCWSMAI